MPREYSYDPFFYLIDVTYHSGSPESGKILYIQKMQVRPSQALRSVSRAMTVWLGRKRNFEKTSQKFHGITRSATHTELRRYLTKSGGQMSN
jgi:hypothetical protein